MPLEQALADNTAAILKLTAVWAQLVAMGDAAQKHSAEGGEVTAAGKTVVKAEAKKTAAAAIPAASTASSKPAKDSPAPLVYGTVQTAIVALAAKHGRPRALEVLGEFGVASGKELTEEQWPAALAAALAATADEAEVA